MEIGNMFGIEVIYISINDWLDQYELPLPKKRMVDDLIIMGVPKFWKCPLFFDICEHS
ncbi:hypothetical protein [Flagellimonas marinaquae]|uniref:hypothetical protein n=1 Tax=Flagellimonas marinaquae TaxID=254955 RepID=UPI0020757F9B|nr:hypothetical protein [Allomuricauda aquimarina]USD25882.1 hypothetical protein MJO53_03065 [Allomuricauda aquimarina]